MVNPVITLVMQVDISVLKSWYGTLACAVRCRWKQLDEEWFKPWFGGLPRTPTALEQRHKVLLEELAHAEAKLHADRRQAVAAEELVGSLELEVADIQKQIHLVQERARAEQRKAAAVAVAMRAAQNSVGAASEAVASTVSETAESGGDGSE